MDVFTACLVRADVRAPFSTPHYRRHGCATVGTTVDAMVGTTVDAMVGTTVDATVGPTVDATVSRS